MFKKKCCALAGPNVQDVPRQRSKVVLQEQQGSSAFEFQKEIKALVPDPLADDGNYRIGHYIAIDY